MHHQQQEDVANHSYRLPPPLAVHCSILTTDVQRVVENEFGHLEADAVLTLIPPVFSFIP
jgi:hypothetical protein